MLTFILAAILSLVLVLLIVEVVSRGTDPHHSFALDVMNHNFTDASYPTFHGGNVKHSGEWVTTSSLFRR